MAPTNLEHPRVQWRKSPGHDCLCSYASGRRAAVRPQTNDSIWDGVIGLWDSVAPLLSPWCAKVGVPTGVNLNRCAGSGSHIPRHSDNEPLWSSRCVVAPRAMRPLRLSWIMVTSWPWTVWPNRSMCIARCLGCKVFGFTFRYVGFRNTLRPDH